MIPPFAKALLGALLAVPVLAAAAVRIIEGPTPIIDGEARSAGDITVVNERLAFALALTSPTPYGVPRGALIDLAPVVNGKIGRDCIVFADFIPDNWGAWPSAQQRLLLLERGPERVVVRTERDWGKVLVTTDYVLAAGADEIEMRTTMHNAGAPLQALSGPTLWPKRGFFFAPSMDGETSGLFAPAAARRVVAYDEDWSIALHAPHAERFASGGMDLLSAHSLASGESRRFISWLQVGARGDLADVVAADIEREHLPSATLRGSVIAADGAPIAAPVVVAEAQGRPYAWFLGSHGEYQARLPSGRYELYATARGYSQSARLSVEVRPGQNQSIDFRGLKAPGRLAASIIDELGAPLDARLTIVAGERPVVQYLGRSTFFTDLHHKGRLDVPLPPGAYRLEVAAGADFLSARREYAVQVSSGHTARLAARIARRFDPPARHWYSADLHHHADRAEAVTPPAALAQSQLAAGLDLLFVSDHDSSANHLVLASIAQVRAMPFIAGIELSASWGHVNAYPLSPGLALAIDTAKASVSELFAEGRRQGAIVLQVNHPFIPYGYLTSVATGSANGGFDPGFDLLEINSEQRADDDKVLHALWNFWNAGHRYYLAAGTDTHDVWRRESGAVRTFAHLAAPPAAAAFAQALKDGHAYVSYGPLVYPEIPFGDTLKVRRDATFALRFDLESVAGLKRLQLIEGGELRASRAWPTQIGSAHVDFSLRALHSTWYALIIEDQQGHKAYTDPIWVDLVESPDAARR